MEFFITLIAFLAFFFCLAVGVVFYNRRLKGSCGGLGALLGKDCSSCACGRGKEEPDEEPGEKN